MILTLFLSFIFISLVMITIGLAKPSESAQALIGFFFLFLLAMTIIGGDLEYSVGENTNTSYSYMNDTSLQINTTTEYKAYNYNNFDDTTSRRIGYYLTVASAVGFAGVLFSLKKTKEEKENE